MPKQQWELALLIKVLRDLDDFLPYLVLVGGWIPFLYSRYLWSIKQEPLLTVDIDFGFKDVAYTGKETVANRIAKRKYGEHHVELGKDVPFVPIAKIEGRDLRAPVEFITGLDTPATIKERLIGHEILINTIQDFDILFERTMKLNVEGISITVPKPEIFVFHKLLTFDQRTKPDKKLKDLFNAYYVLFFSPDEDALRDDVRGLIRTHPAGKRVRANIEKYFNDAQAKGPTMIVDGAIGSTVSGITSDIREDAHARITALLRSDY